MSLFEVCQVDNCPSLAEVRCSCGIYICRSHLGEHVLNNLNSPHQQTPVSQSLTPEDASGLQVTEDTLQRRLKALVSEIVSERNKRVESLLRKVREIEEQFSQEIEMFLRRQDSLLRILKEIRERGYAPLSSDCLLYTSDAADE